MLSKSNQSFHPRLLIVDHFDAIINQIDIKIETKLDKLIKSELLTKEKQNELNETRLNYINRVREIQRKNLDHLGSKEFNEEEYAQKWSHVLDESSLEFKQKIDLLKKELIVYDCVLMEQSNLENGCFSTQWNSTIFNFNDLN